MTDDEQKKIFASNLRRLTTGESQRDIAKQVGVSPQTFNTWYKGKALPRMGKIERLATCLGVEKTELIDRVIDDETGKEIKRVTRAYSTSDPITRQMVRRILNLED